ncbi:unnamed protein product [Acanthoscelides obtectus]|uniref:Zinc finger PHD-type domain-containing protein n=1 Tax=Acanthoscelides obtectus TaxID=200917 RepID=A0A9P0JWQ2_ACAOB|nr:unnamed protein product [Acanthoscelides obtectus]CAK1647920.1 hypothetical protein AOBTE_LOCUS15455 [Acanthoscelides obtectus]
MSASIISSTPMKEELELKKQLMEEKENKRKLKVSTSVTKEPKDVKNKPKKKPNKERDDVKKKSKDASSEESKQKYYCPGCGELYVDPPTENWVQCTGCLEWWHDKCSRFEGRGDFKCDFCD